MKIFTEHMNEKFRGKHLAFTMAEILISLTIVGVIAAIVIPSLAGNIEKKTLVARQKAFYSRMSQALAMIDKNLNKYGQYSATYNEENSSLNVTLDTGAMAFVMEALGQTIKMNNICDNENFKKCGVPDKIIDMSGSPKNVPKTLSELWNGFTRPMENYSPVNTDAVAFETINGESAIVYYNPKCKSYKSKYYSGNYGEYIMPRVCVNIIYDVNGKKGPNSIFKDVFILTMLGPENPNIVSPIVSHTGVLVSRDSYCQSFNDGSRLADVDETVSAYINKGIIADVNAGNRNYGCCHTSNNASIFQYYNVIGSLNGGCAFCIKKK